MCDDSVLGEGVYVGKKAVINSESKIGNCCIINTASIVEHNCCLSDFVHISPGAVLCGGVNIGLGTHIGAGAVIKQGVSIGKHSIIGLASAVVSDIEDNAVAYGNPCKTVRKNEV